MSFEKQLFDDFGYERPIILKDIVDKYSDEYSYSTLRTKISRLVKAGKLNKLVEVKGVYYFSTIEERFGFEIKPVAIEIIKRKFIENDEIVKGFESDFSFLNRAGLTTQMPMVTTIATKEIERNTTIKLSSVTMLEKLPRGIKLTEKNKFLYQVLFMLAKWGEAYKERIEIRASEADQKLVEYARQGKYSKIDVKNFMDLLNDKRKLNIVESGVFYELI